MVQYPRDVMSEDMICIMRFINGCWLLCNVAPGLFNVQMVKGQSASGHDLT